MVYTKFDIASSEIVYVMQVEQKVGKITVVRGFMLCKWSKRWGKWHSSTWSGWTTHLAGPYIFYVCMAVCVLVCTHKNFSLFPLFFPLESNQCCSNLKVEWSVLNRMQMEYFWLLQLQLKQHWTTNGSTTISNPHSHTLMGTHTHTHIHTLIHTHTHTDTHKQTHTYTHTCQMHTNKCYIQANLCL